MLAITALALFAASTSVARDPDILPRIGKWQVDYDQDSCHLYARFGIDKDQVLARFTRFSPTNNFDLLLMGDRVDVPGSYVKTKLEFDGGKPDDFWAMVGRSGKDGKDRLIVGSGVRVDGWVPPKGAKNAEAPPVPPEFETSVASLTVSVEGVQPFRLTFGSLGKPLAELRTCTDALLRDWGYDPAQQAQLTRKPKPVTNAAKWLTSRDFPTKATRQGANGIVQFRLDIDPAGTATACRVLFRTDPDVFADKTCALVMQRARFEPAIDAAGKPVRSYFIRKVNWMTPD